MRRDEPPSRDAFVLQFGLQCVQGFKGTGYDTEGRSIDCRDGEVAVEARANLGFGQAYGKHSTGSEFLHHVPAGSDEGESIFQRKNAG